MRDNIVFYTIMHTMTCRIMNSMQSGADAEKINGSCPGKCTV